MIRLAMLALIVNLMIVTLAAAEYLDVGGSKIYFESHGTGPTIIFMHDGLLHSEVWDGQLAAFSGEYRFMRYDRRGYGRSDTPTAPFSNENDLLKLIDANDIDRAVLVGSSSAGGIAVNFALDHPDRVSALVLVGAVVDGLGFSNHFTRRNMTNFGADEEGRIDRLVADPWAVAPQNTVAKARVRELLNSNPNDLAFEKHRFARAYANLNPPPKLALNRLHEIKVPTLVTASGLNLIVAPHHAEEIHSRIAGSRKIILEGSGHVALIEVPEKFARICLDFLHEVAEPG